MRIIDPVSAWLASHPPKNLLPKPKPKAASDVSERGLNFIAGWEGCELRPYNDAAGHATIGIGNLIHYGNVTAADRSRFAGFTRTDALRLLREDAAVAVRGVRSLGVPLLTREFDALVSFAFNCGVGALQQGIRARLRAGDKQGAMAVLMQYTHAGGIVLQGLVNRRRAERALFLNGRY